MSLSTESMSTETMSTFHSTVAVPVAAATSGDPISQVDVSDLSLRYKIFSTPLYSITRPGSTCPSTSTSMFGGLVSPHPHPNSQSCFALAELDISSCMGWSGATRVGINRQCRAAVSLDRNAGGLMISTPHGRRCCHFVVQLSPHICTSQEDCDWHHQRACSVAWEGRRRTAVVSSSNRGVSPVWCGGNLGSMSGGDDDGGDRPPLD
jgi:hypothetical protein